MTFPIDIHIGIVVIPSHFILTVIAFYIAYEYYCRLRHKQGDVMSEGHRWIVLIGTLFGALLGSRLLGALDNPYLFFHPPNLLYYYLDQTIVGGVIGGIIGAEIIKKIIREKSSSGDLLTYPLILGIMIGRIGCFLTGVSDGTAGLPSNLPWAFNQGDGIARHPTALYEILFLAILWLVLRRLQEKYVFSGGILFKSFIFAYCAFRFLAEFIKPVVPVAFGLSAIQIVCVVAAIYYGIWLFWRTKWTLNTGHNRINAIDK